MAFANWAIEHQSLPILRYVLERGHPLHVTKQNLAAFARLLQQGQVTELPVTQELVETAIAAQLDATVIDALLTKLVGATSAITTSVTSASLTITQEPLAKSVNKLALTWTSEKIVVQATAEEIMILPDGQLAYCNDKKKRITEPFIFNNHYDCYPVLIKDMQYWVMRNGPIFRWLGTFLPDGNFLITDNLCIDGTLTETPLFAKFAAYSALPRGVFRFQLYQNYELRTRSDGGEGCTIPCEFTSSGLPTFTTRPACLSKYLDALQQLDITVMALNGVVYRRRLNIWHDIERNEYYYMHKSGPTKLTATNDTELGCLYADGRYYDHDFRFATIPRGQVPVRFWPANCVLQPVMVSTPMRTFLDGIGILAAETIYNILNSDFYGTFTAAGFRCLFGYHRGKLSAVTSAELAAAQLGPFIDV